MNKREYSKLIKIINNYDVICFDLFDTILDRIYSPKYSFYIVSDKLIEEYDLPHTIEGLCNSLTILFSDCKNKQQSVLKNIYFHYHINLYDDYESFEKKFLNWFLMQNVIILNPQILLQNCYLLLRVIKKYL